MNKVASFAAILALLALGVYFYSAQPRNAAQLDNATPAGLSSADGGSCCSQSSESMVAAAAGSCCSNGGSEMVSTGGESCCANKTEVAACCSEKSEMVTTEAGSCCSEKTETVATGEAKSCPCQAGKTETVATGSEKADCHGDCENGCCQEKKAEGEVAKTEGGEGK
ncbi:MAG: hypothetical protein ACK49R_16090 [Planctomycetota bacterium]|jgi:hypothetical protein|nr:hypothetical protein [Blastopirellula sp.]